MQFNFNKVIRDLSDKEISDSVGPITFRRVTVMALLENNDPKLPAIEKGNRFTLAIKLETDDYIDLTIDEQKQLKDRVGAFCSTLIVGRFNQFIEAQPRARLVADEVG